MSPDSPSLSGWNNTDEEHVRVSGTAASAENPVRIPPVQPTIRFVPTAKPSAQRASGDALRMRLAAIAGVSIVLVATAFYFGVVNLRSSLLSGVVGSGQTVTITTDGEFSPAALSVTTGESITITNQNAEPQVMKSQDTRELFPVQVIFDTPFTFTIPADASGEYVYLSETLPSGRTLTFSVTAAPAAAPASSAASSEDMTDIPIPFGSPVDTPIPFGSPVDTPIPFGSSQSSSSSSSSTSSSSSSSSSSWSGGGGGGSGGGGGGGGTTTINVGGGGSGGPYRREPLVPAGRNALPTNPYTVSAVNTYTQPFESESKGTKGVTPEPLHKGAEITPLKTHTPKKVSETGPEGAVLLFIPAFLGILVLFRKVTHA